MSRKQEAPDYRGAAEETARGNAEALRYQTDANRADQYTPFGNVQWFGQPGDENYRQETQLTNNQQAIFDQQEEAQFQRQLANSALANRMWEDMERPENFYNNLPSVAGTPDVPMYGGGLGEFGQGGRQMELQNYGGGLGEFGQSGQKMNLQNYGEGLGQFGQGGQQMSVQDMQSSAYDPAFAEQAFDRQMSLIQPTLDNQLESQEVALRNQGLTPGSEAYDRALSTLRGKQSETINALSADAVDRGRAEQQAEFTRAMQSGDQRFGQEAALFGAQMDQGSMYDRQRAQQAQEQLGFGGQRFDEQSRLFDAQMSQANLLDRQRAQQTDEQLRFGGQRFNEQSKLFDAQMMQAALQDRQRGQQVQEQLAFGDQSFRQQAQQAEMQNMLRQRGITEQQNRENNAFNLMNSAATGQNVALPQMPGYNTAGYAGGPDYLGAAKAQGAADSAANSSMFGALGYIGGGMMGGPIGSMIGGKVASMFEPKPPGSE